MQSEPIGLFDSGVGGLSIFLEIKKFLPGESIIYFADQKNVPYGGKTASQIRNFSQKIVKFLISQNVKLVVAACNTASVYALGSLRAQFPRLSIVGVVPIIKTLAQLSVTGNVAILTTPATAKSDYLKGLIGKYAKGVKVFALGLDGIEEQVEKGELNDGSTIKLLKKHLTSLRSKNIDFIGLGCTHYPFLKKQIQKIIDGKAQILDSGEAVAKRVNQLLKEANNLSLAKHGNYKFFTTGKSELFYQVASKLLNDRSIEVNQVIL